jgi:nucleotide-binding universal stress UspA family protein
MVLTLRKPARPTAIEGYRRALVPVVAGAEGELALDLACRFASDSRAVVVALATIEIPLDQPLDVPVREQEARAHALLERALAIGASYGVRVTPRIVRTRSAGDAVLEEVVRNRTEIVVLGLPHVRRERSLDRTTEFVVKHAPCRVMLASVPAG